MKNWKEGRKKEFFFSEIFEQVKRSPWNVRHVIDLPEDTDRSNELLAMAVKGRHAIRIRKLVPTLSSSSQPLFVVNQQTKLQLWPRIVAPPQRKSDFYYFNRVLSVNYEILGEGSKILLFCEHINLPPLIEFLIRRDLIRN